MVDAAAGGGAVGAGGRGSGCRPGSERTLLQFRMGRVARLPMALSLRFAAALRLGLAARSPAARRWRAVAPQERRAVEAGGAR